MPPSNSPMEDDNPTVPRPEPAKIDQSQAPPDWQRLAQLPDFKDHIASRIKFYQDYLPTGEPIAGIKKKEELLTAWQNATILIRELETIKNTAELVLRGVKPEAPKDER